ncbi:MAG: hypothetical protein WDA74_06205 [Spirochaetota bacterium]
MFKKIKQSRRKEEEIVSYIEQEAGCTIPDKAREAIINELCVSYKLNGHISQGYIDNLIKAYKYAYGAKSETADPKRNAVSVV